MDRQTLLRLEDEQARFEGAAAFCEGRGLSERQVKLLCLICAQGTPQTINGQSLSVAQLAKADAGKRLGCSVSWPRTPSSMASVPDRVRGPS